MSGSALIGSLRVALGIDTAEFSSDAKKAKGILSGLSGTFKAFAVGAAGAFSFAAIGVAIKSAANHMDELGKAAQKIGMPVEQLSSLEYAARLADVSLEGLQTSMNKFNKMLGELAGGKTNTASEGLRAIGVAAVDANGKLRPSSDILADIAEKFAGYKDGAEKSALAMAIFGKSGAEMIPLLNGGRAAIEQAKNEAKLFGLVVSKESAAAAEQFNDNLTRLKMSLEGLAQRVTTAILPALNNLTQGIVDYLGKGGGAQKITEGLMVALRRLAEIAVKLYYDFQKFATSATYWWDRLNGADYDPAKYNQLKADLASIEEQYKKSKAAVDNFSFAEKGPNKGLGGLRADPIVPEKPAAPILPDLVAIKKEANEAQKAMERLKEEGKQVYESTRTPIEAYQIEVARLSTLLKEGAIDQDTYNRAVANLRDEFSNTTDEMKSKGSEIAQTLQGAFKSWIESAMQGTFKLKDALGDLLQSLTKIALNSALSSLMGGANHPLYGGGGGGLGGLFGSLFGFAKGGTILPGGSGGIDSQLVMFRKSPNERVDISKPGQSITSGGGDLIINDYRTNAPRAEAKKDDQGNFVVVLRDQINSTINGGYTDKSFASRFAMQPARVRR